MAAFEVTTEAKWIAPSSIETGDWVTMAWVCMIYDHNLDPISYLNLVADQKQQLIDCPIDRLVRNKDCSNLATAPAKICDDGWLGFDSVMLKGVTV